MGLRWVHVWKSSVSQHDVVSGAGFQRTSQLSVHLIMTRLTIRHLALAVAIPFAGLLCATPLHAQVRTARIVAADGAQRAIAAALAEAKKQGWNVSIAVVDVSGDLLAFLRMDGASVASTDVSRAKARTAARFRRATRYYDSTATAGRLQVMALEGMTPIEGGVPIIVNGEVIGAIGVSGATSAQDAQVAQAGAAAILP
jgi:glc operon protein GlcG